MHIDVKPEMKLYIREELVTRGQENVRTLCVAAEVKCKANCRN